MQSFREIDASHVDSAHLKNELDSRGYALIRRLLPFEDIENLLRKIAQILSDEGWLLPNQQPIARAANLRAACSESDPAFKRLYEKVFNLEALHSFAHHPKVFEVMRLLVGPKLLVHPKPIVRLIFPNCDRSVIHAHQDHLAVGGDTNCFTAWLPLHDCPAELGPLQVLEGSHRFGLQDADPDTGVISKGNVRGREWVSGAINAGDALIFHSLTVHSASPNTSSQLRISMDCRFQDYSHILNPANFVFPGSNDRSWESTYAYWVSKDLKYFWKHLPLRFKPSIDELTTLVNTVDSERMRVRYGRILSQIKLQMPLDTMSEVDQGSLSSQLPLPQNPVHEGL
ncbi:phytanoyl-CoA dioxygenase family protein [Tunturiibacter empetritectus]|uniref:Ectoine hydroxylase-related dioxygenase (Phytanoyl-CoA dioxygenase family) n=2 Tax=Tunturiibacter TaxID=3154218 RepID=A0A852V9H7_9BACT|nr:phytanoyl-CoA dioxygenase family protein [Edaphobacter lichenicola]NYF88350.1 ectoine hydroxylase-related dioxygenase (phytanoyl-CoA dioxygenase family) [Edaphobacter lichenicola]